MNIRYVEILDFLTGWFGYDLAGDDDNPYGKWPWQDGDPATLNVPKRVQIDF